MKNTRVIGLMSGTSLDGLDICYVVFSENNEKWTTTEVITRTIKYSIDWEEKLASAFYADTKDIDLLNLSYGKLIAKNVNDFIHENNLAGKVDFIASHGHTIFHQPDQGITLQIGDGQIIADETKLEVISDFRSLDVSLGGQGAPLVPVGDELLFSAYDACLNLGGFANISYNKKPSRSAFDISPCNLPLNKVMQSFFQKPFDSNGENAAKGKVNEDLLKILNNLSYYKKEAPKSLGVEWLNEVFYPILDRNKKITPENLLRTVLEHETDQISRVINKLNLKTVLITGGGVWNKFFINRLTMKTSSKIVIPSPEIVDFKEALIFAFLGVLRINGAINTYKSVTGAKKDSSGGVLTFPRSLE